MSSDTTQHAWDIYARKLWSLGYGHPLWTPEPLDGETSIGDVGYIKEGRFLSFFNSMKDLSEQRLDEDGDPRVPANFAPFNKKNLTYDKRPEHIRQGMLCSKSMRAIDTSAGFGTSPVLAPIASAGLGASFRCFDESGAVLALESAGHSVELVNKRHVVNYMREHFESWREYANGDATLGLGLRTDEILFVSGTTKTTGWGVAAFSSRSRRGEVHVHGEAQGVAGGHFSVDITHEDAPWVQYRSGPSRPQSQGVLAIEGRASEQTQTDGRDQTVFVHYYKMIDRFFWKRVIRARAGFHDLPDADEDDDNDTKVVHESSLGDEFSETDSPMAAFDPVSALLEYIMEFSEAEVAVASTRDLLALCTDDEEPWDDIPAMLRRIQPTIDVDDRKVGTISAEFLSSLRPQPIGEAAASEAPASQEQRADDTEQSGGYQPTDDGFQMPPDSPKIRTVNLTMDHAGSVTSLVLSPDGKYAASASDDMLVVLRDLEDHSRRWSFEGHTDTVWCIVFAPDSKRLVSGGGDGNVVVWEVPSGRQLAALLGHTEPVQAVAYSPNGTIIASAGDDGEIRLWDAQALVLHRVLGGPGLAITLLRFSPNGHWLASGGTESVARIWDVDAGRAQTALEGHVGTLAALAFSPDSRRVISASDDCSARVWMAETGAALVILHEHTAPVWDACFSPDGLRVLTAASDGTARVCDSFTGERLLSLEGHESMVNAAAFAPDGEKIATGSADCSVKVWDAAEGKCVRTFKDHHDKVVSVAFAPNGRALVSSSYDGVVRIRDLHAAETWAEEE